MDVPLSRSLKSRKQKAEAVTHDREAGELSGSNLRPVSADHCTIARTVSQYKQQELYD
jgi:hypothetical protein